MTSGTPGADPLSISVDQGGSHFGPALVTGGVLFQGNLVNILSPSSGTASARKDYVGHYAHSSLRRLKKFVDRPKLHDKIREALKRDDTKLQESRVVGIWGLGGAGKTQLARGYLHRHRDDYRAVFWIEASHNRTIERDFINIYQHLYSVPLSEVNGPDRLAEAVLRVKSWLNHGDNHFYLFVFDGADSVDNPEAEDYIDLSYFMPDSPSVDVIVTSRSRTLQDVSLLGGVNVEGMDNNEAVELFCKVADLATPSADTLEEVGRIVDELGCLALAVTLAGSYTQHSLLVRSDISRYLPEYLQRRRELLQRKPTWLVHQYGRSVLTTWETSLHAAQEESALVTNLLSLFAFLSHDDIYFDLFGLTDAGIHGKDKSPLAHQKSSSWQTRLFNGKQATLNEIEECLRVLERYSLVQGQEDQQSYGMHPLVHAWSHDRLSTEDLKIFAVDSVELICDAISRCGTTPTEKLRLAPHVMASFTGLQSTGPREVVEIEIPKMILKLKSQISEILGALDESEVLEISEVLGVLETSEISKRVETLVLCRTVRQMGAMASFINGLGQWSDVLRIQEYILRTCVEVFGDQDPDTISAKHNIAATLAELGKLDEAASVQRDVLSKRVQILGKEHPDTISAMNNLAATLADQEKLDEAAAIQQDIPLKQQQILGDKHPDMISIMNNLAATLADQEKLDEAAAIYRDILSEQQQILGDKHPDIICAMQNLATILGEQGELGEAVAMQRDVLSKQQQILGDKHPETITMMNNLATTLQYQGELDEAAAVRRDVLSKRQQILGNNHPRTITAMNNLATTLVQQEKLDEAAALQQDVLSKRQQILGNNHPHTITAMNKLATTLVQQEKLDEAAALQQDVLSKRVQILGKEHPDTISAMSNLATTLADQGKLDEAAAMQQDVLSKRVQILGKEHPDTIDAIEILCDILDNQWKLGELPLILKEIITTADDTYWKQLPEQIEELCRCLDWEWIPAGNKFFIGVWDSERR